MWKWRRRWRLKAYLYGHGKWAPPSAAVVTVGAESAYCRGSVGPAIVTHTIAREDTAGSAEVRAPISRDDVCSAVGAIGTTGAGRRPNRCPCIVEWPPMVVHRPWCQPTVVADPIAREADASVVAKYDAVGRRRDGGRGWGGRVEPSTLAAVGAVAALALALGPGAASSPIVTLAIVGKDTFVLRSNGSGGACVERLAGTGGKREVDRGSEGVLEAKGHEVSDACAHDTPCSPMVRVVVWVAVRAERAAAVG